MIETGGSMNSIEVRKNSGYECRPTARSLRCRSLACAYGRRNITGLDGGALRRRSSLISTIFANSVYSVALFCILLLPAQAISKEKQPASLAPPSLEVEVISVKYKGSWTQVGIAIKNLGTADAPVSCCGAFIEDGDGYAVASLKRDEIAQLIHNKAKTAAAIGAIVGLGLGIGGAVGGVDELEYAGIALGGASGIGAVAGSAAAESQQRNLIVDDIMRNTTFPAGLKVAGFVFFPPKKKWPGKSREAKAIHLTYLVNGAQYSISAPVEILSEKESKKVTPHHR